MTFPRKWFVHLNYRPEALVTDLFLLAEMEDGGTYVAKPIILEETARHGIVREPTLVLANHGFGSASSDFLQAMVDAAWNVGIRPSGVKDLEGTLGAVRFHLEDMRKLAKVK